MGEKKQTLDVRMRPQTIDDIVGQDHLTHKNSVLWKMVNNELLSSIILYGPPGTGKTSIAHVIANSTDAEFYKVNAVQGKKQDLEDVIKMAKKNEKEDKFTILFIDEIHRFNKAQQDYLLPFVEDGTVILIGATTENPFFEVNHALVSRSKIFQLKPITKEDVIKTLKKAMDKDEIMKNCGKTVTDEIYDLIAEQTGGDVRQALKTLELACFCEDNDTVSEETVKDIIQKPNLLYDKDGDMHYDTISAFIKSMRGSDPDAVLYYLARMIYSGEEPEYIARRIMIHASEDVGNADPMALVVATCASLAAERVGWPEAQIILAQAATYIAMAPKSNTAARGIGEAMEYVAKHPTIDIPNYLRDSHYKSASKLGHGVGYKYPHDFPDHWVPQQYLPDEVKNECFYHNSHNGHEQTQADYQNSIRQNRRNEE